MKKMLKENAALNYQQREENDVTDVNLTSKDMEVNFSNKQEDDDELEAKLGDLKGPLAVSAGPERGNGDTMDTFEETELLSGIPGVPEDIKIVADKGKLEENKVQEQKKQVQ